MNLGENELSIGDIVTQKGTTLVRRYKDGKLNLQTLFPEEGAARIAERPLVEGATTVVEKAQQPKKPWLVKVGKVSLDQYTITWEDQSLAEPLTLTADEIALKAENLSTAKGQKGNVSLGLRLDQKGTLSVAGPVGIDPLAAELKLGLKDISINSLQSYFTDKVKIIVQDGYFGMNGNLSVKREEGKEIQMTYKGDSSITRFVAVDKAKCRRLPQMGVALFERNGCGYQPAARPPQFSGFDQFLLPHYHSSGWGNERAGYHGRRREDEAGPRRKPSSPRNRNQRKTPPLRRIKRQPEISRWGRSPCRVDTSILRITTSSPTTRPISLKSEEGSRVFPRLKRRVVIWISGENSAAEPPLKSQGRSTRSARTFSSI